MNMIIIKNGTITYPDTLHIINPDAAASATDAAICIDKHQTVIYLIDRPAYLLTDSEADAIRAVVSTHGIARNCWIFGVIDIPGISTGDVHIDRNITY